MEKLDEQVIYMEFLKVVKIPERFTGVVTITYCLNQGGVRDIKKCVEERVK